MGKGKGKGCLLTVFDHRVLFTPQNLVAWSKSGVRWTGREPSPRASCYSFLQVLLCPALHTRKENPSQIMSVVQVGGRLT